MTPKEPGEPKITVFIPWIDNEERRRLVEDAVLHPLNTWKEGQIRRSRTTVPGPTPALGARACAATTSASALRGPEPFYRYQSVG
jgi:hypothetical protein